MFFLLVILYRRGSFADADADADAGADADACADARSADYCSLSGIVKNGMDVIYSCIVPLKKRLIFPEKYADSAKFGQFYCKRTSNFFVNNRHCLTK